MQVYFLPECTTDTDSSTLLKNYQDLSFKIQDYWGKQMPHTFREIIHHEMTHLAKRCEEENVPYLWECLGILFQTELSSENGRECSQEEMAKLRRGIDVNSTIGSDFVEGLSGRSMEYNLLEKYISCWVERMSEVITGVLKDSMHINDLGLKHRPGENVDALKRMFQKEIRGKVTRWEYTISPCTDSHMRLGGFFGKCKWDRKRVALAMFDHENKPFSGAIQENRFRKNAPAAIFILSQFLLWSRFCKEDHHHLIKLFSSSITEYMQIRTGNRLDAMRWTMNYYHNVIDSVHYSYHYWKKYYFVPVPTYPIQNNPAQVIHLCLLGSAIKTCSEFFRKLGVKASWQNTGWDTGTALETLSSNDTGRIKVAPNVDTYLTISHSY